MLKFTSGLILGFMLGMAAVILLDISLILTRSSDEGDADGI